MLKTTLNSRANKTKGLAVTYRSGSENKFGTCPKDCELNPSGCGSNTIDEKYLNALLNCKPKKGESFTFTHFSPLFWKHKMSDKTTTINWSTKTVKQAIQAIKDKIPSVLVVDDKFFKNGKNRKFDNVLFVRCPSEYNKNLGCLQCGSGKPLCARQDLEYVIGFTSHGVFKKDASDPNKKGGCYGNGGNVNIHWQKMPNQIQPESDAEKLKNFKKELPHNAIIRHHVVGDLGHD